jgi:hypothetical protein
VHCGIDYGTGEADDLMSAKAANMTACMKKCATTKQCDGAGWGYINGDGKDKPMLSRLVVLSEAAALFHS